MRNLIFPYAKILQHLDECRNTCIQLSDICPGIIGLYTHTYKEFPCPSAP